MLSNQFAKPALLALVIAIIFTGGWEWYLRSKGVNIAYDDGKELWADKRARVNTPREKATVFIGSSRIKYDLDIPTWRQLTGRDAIQLAIEGSSPLPVLDDLAADENFAGDLIVDVTEGLFFASRPGAIDEPSQFCQYYQKLTPTQKMSFVLNRQLESRFVFLDRDNFSINAMLHKLQVPDREGVFSFPVFPLEFGRVTFDRQNLMTDRFLTDTTLQNRVTGIWLFFRSRNKELPASGPKLDSILTTIKAAVDRIRSRGGEVVFVRTPSSGPFWQGEQKAFPREKYWERLLTETNARGIHFADYEDTNHFICPEWSHLSPKDAVLYTKSLVQVLEQDLDWKFRSVNVVVNPPTH